MKILTVVDETSEGLGLFSELHHNKSYQKYIIL